MQTPNFTCSSPQGLDTNTNTGRNTRLSYLYGFFCNQPLTCTLHEVMSIVKNSNTEQLTNSIRSYMAASENQGGELAQRGNFVKQADNLKKQLPMFTFSVLLEGGKSQKYIKEFTGLVAIDIDNKTTEEVVQLMEKGRNNPYCIFMQSSSRGHGLHLVFNTDSRDFLNSHWDGKDKAPYTWVWNAVRQHVKDNFDAEADKLCKDLCRGMAICADPQTYFNPDAQALHIDTEGFGTKKSKGQTRKPGTSRAKAARLDAVIDSIQQALAKAGKKPEEGQRNDYVYVFACKCNEFGVEEDEVKAYCLEHFQQEDFPETEINATVASAYKNEDEHGTRSKKDKYANYEELTALIDGYGQWRMNELTLEYEIKTEADEDYRTVRDEDINEVFRRGREANLYINKSEVENILHSKRTEHYNPVLDYLNGLPACTILADGRCRIEGRTEERDYIAELIARVKTESPSEEVCKYFKKWFVAMVKSWIYPEFVNELALGLLGKQGIFKTTFLRMLLPGELSKKYFDIKETNGLYSKDDKIKLANTLLYDLEEVDGMSPRELNEFKAIVSMKEVKVRLPYGRNVVTRKRLASFAFTGNKREILNDSTGNRRFIPFWVISILDPHKNPIDYEALYAQALQLAKSDFECYVPSKEIDALNKHNEEFSMPVLEVELVNHYLGVPSATDYYVWEPLGIIAGKLYARANHKKEPDLLMLANALKQAGFIKKRTKSGFVYCVRYLEDRDIQSRYAMEGYIPKDAS